MVIEKQRAALGGGFVLIAILLGGIIDLAFIRMAAVERNPLEVFAGVAIGIVLFVCLGGLFVVNPNEAEAALRNMVTSYPYDSHDEQHQSLRGHTGSIAAHLKAEIQEKVQLAGVEIVDARISHLAYAPEIAQAMLQRQQASAIIAARQKIVEGAVGMVQMALERLSRDKVVQLDEERK